MWIETATEEEIKKVFNLISAKPFQPDPNNPMMPPVGPMKYWMIKGLGDLFPIPPIHDFHDFILFLSDDNKPVNPVFGPFPLSPFGGAFDRLWEKIVENEQDVYFHTGPIGPTGAVGLTG
ncbi:MAG: hypothetical protein Q8K86_10745 [Candidatus Nanopelagicaceae bacterium]|nr:hypothetical protein [Candidatus Nanopelagicaceae bacterium]